jgi:hypothetical protein
MEYSNNINDITNQDIYDADLSTSGENERVIEIFEMEKTIWFKQIVFYPVNLSEMEFFLSQLDILNIFKNFDTNDILKMGAERLDAYFFILKKINLETVKFCEYCVFTYFEKEFKELFFSRVMINSSFLDLRSVNSFLDEFCMDVGEYLVHFLTIFKKIM